MILKVLVVALALGNLAFGAFALVSPDQVGSFVGFELQGSSGRGELRAVFGGLVLVLGGLMLASLWHPDGAAWRRALSLAFGGLALGRLVSLVADGPTTYTLIALLIELGSAVLLALRLERRVEPA